MSSFSTKSVFLAGALAWLIAPACNTEDEDEDSSGSETETPLCGDEVINTDLGEACDDGNRWGGDGCSPSCQAELGAPEEEQNDTLEEAQGLLPGDRITGALPTDDVDCFAIEIREGGWLEADLVGDGEGTCPEASTLALYSPSGALLASGSPGGDSGCAPILPALAEGARFMTGGTWTLCIAPFLEGVVPTYTLDWEAGEDSCALDDVPILPSDDPDGDGVANRCDADDDGDGVADGDDNCPTVPNGPNDPGLVLGEDGFLRHWLLTGPYFGNTSEDTCLPSPIQLLGGPDDSEATIRIAGPAGDSTWVAHIEPDSRIDFEHLRTDDAPREVYISTWVFSPKTRSVLLALGPDDGVRAWLNGEVVGEVSDCQGTHADQFRFDAELTEGWNSVLLKVYDQGGGWGTFARFLHTGDNSGPVNDLGISLVADGPWTDDQGDQDEDGQGDFCDETPADPKGGH